MLGIVVALYNEAKNVIEKTNAKIKPVKINKNVYFGKIRGVDFALIISGIGKVNAALCTQFLIDNYAVDKILNFGSVGGIAGKVNPREYYAVDKCCQYDFDLSALDDVPVGYIQDYDTVYFYPKTDETAFLPFAGLATSDKFTEKTSDIDIIRKLDCSIFDMEGGAIAEVCAANKIPFYMFKGVTDTHGSGNDANTFYENLNAVCEGFYPILLKTIE